MAERHTLELEGYVLYAELLDRLRERFPAVPSWRLEQIVNAEYEAFTGGVLRIVPVEVESGAVEMLSRENAPHDDEEVA